ncbi:ABC transporter substrate-binding protein [Streptomyces ipomoeae]|uniref:Putative aliphatic sulfonates-binding protein n=1 Tax=Streptomyces ipomoeae 91-03 TaxID=698759 RepID=L1KWZ1_9ACTN|nr:ABC transporter substrate-binding protein [Streptomyces ipomoeae]EKX64858.1 ABC transporter, substrate-binding protein, aliphatic sulfonates family protein [Streptomyces ipomoeae 91-03]MDX2692071.1 ABC transporter substrate-binding protein [Streptomyces ipomoeae]MDX2820091.1 ABC transporter substrate-binding protein [Streptomyces ipomoeae]MDX2837654.1 ABC transporter substrate-binding protein [Streptomyces ipomoeae]MDX2874589.1 ABC transporter substrate-binding protein [Streptomyces ipomoea
MRRRLVPALLLPLALLLSACGGSSSANTSIGDGTDGKGSLTLNVGDQKGGSEAILRAAGELENLDYKIKWSTFTSGPPLLEAVNAKAVDIGGVGNTPPVFAAGANSRITVVAAFHGTSKGDAILVPNDSKLTRAQQLKGRSIAVAQGSSAHYQLVASLEAAGLSLSDVNVKYLQPADALAAFNSGKVDAWAVWDPYTSQVLQAEQGRVLTTGEGITNGLTFQVAAPDALKDKKKAAAIKDYLERLRRAQKWVHGHQAEWAKVWSKDTGLPYDVALAAVKRSNASRIPVAVDEPLIASEQKIADAFTELKLIPREVDFADFVDERFNGDLPPSTTPARGEGS